MCDFFVYSGNDNWFTTIELMHYLKSNAYLAVGTLRGNRNKGYPLMANKDFSKQERGSVDYRVDKNSGLIVVKWLDNSIVQLTSNYVGVEPVGSIQRWDGKVKCKKDIPCPSIVLV